MAVWRAAWREISGGAEGGNGEVEEEGDGGQVKRMQGEVVQRETRRGDKGRTESEAGR